MHRASIGSIECGWKRGTERVSARSERENMNGADFALHIMNAPAVGARPGSTDELAALGLDRRLRLALSTKYQGEAGLCELEKLKICLTDAASSWKSIS